MQLLGGMAGSGLRRGLYRTGLAVGLLALTRTASASDVLETTGFTNCDGNAPITVQKVDIRYNADNKTVTFDVAGTNTQEQKVTAMLNVTAYGQQIYSNSFDPCANDTFVQQLCPVPAGTFAATGTQAIPASYASMVPAIAFQIPDIAAQATLQLKSEDTGENVACIQSQVGNGKTASVPAVSYVAASVAGAALILSGMSAASAVVAGAGSGAAAGGSAVGGAGTLSPSFVEVFTWFQGMAMNGMLSVNYPQVYRSFTKNFGFSTGLIPWNSLQLSIDSFRAHTGGNLTQDNVQYLQNATLVFADGSTDNLASEANSTLKVKRAFAMLTRLAPRQITTSINGTTTSGSGSADASGGQGNGDVSNTIRVATSGIQAYVEALSIPSANTFMTVLLVVAIVIAAIVVGVLLVKVVLETWALFGNFPKSLKGFRKHYWGSIARAITNLILLLYGVWVLYCIFQFTNGDSWAAKALAGATLGVFTAILLFFSYKIWRTANRLKQTEGDTSALYEDKSIWVKYSLFYESYRKNYWWIFVPSILYMFVKGCMLAGADGHGLVQTGAQLVVESLMLVLLLWSRPYERRSGNIINIVIQVVRVLSVVCILVFVEEFGIVQTTQTIAGVVLIAVQSAMTGILAILMIWNALIACCKENPHRKRRKEMEKLQREEDALTPLDARNSLLMDRSKAEAMSDTASTLSLAKTGGRESATASAQREVSPDRYMATPSAVPEPLFAGRPSPPKAYRPLTPNSPFDGRPQTRENLMQNAAPMAMGDGRRPTIPNVSGGYGNSGNSGYRPAPTSYDSYGRPAAAGPGYGQRGNGGYGGGGGQYSVFPPHGGYQ